MCFHETDCPGSVMAIFVVIKEASHPRLGALQRFIAASR